MNKIFTKLANGDCLTKMKLIPDGSVDLVLCDPPYGTTKCPWDTVIDFKLMWNELHRLVKPNGAIVLFGNQPFTSTLIVSNIKNYKYNWTWIKHGITGHLSAKKMPTKRIEDCMVFYKSPPTYNPQNVVKFSKPKEFTKSTKVRNAGKNVTYATATSSSPMSNIKDYTQDFTGYPSNVLRFKSEADTVHPTQKPVKMLEYLIKTYTNEGEVVLDFTMGSGSTGVACVNTDRSFIGIELDKEFFKISQDRIEKAKLAPKTKKLF